MRDFLGNEIKIGDKIVAILPAYREFVNGYVKSFTPQKVRIVYEYRRYGRELGNYDLLQDPKQIIVIKE